MVPDALPKSDVDHFRVDSHLNSPNQAGGTRIVVIKFSAAALQLPRLRACEHVSPQLAPINPSR
jgi:hypothetical protein